MRLTTLTKETYFTRKQPTSLSFLWGLNIHFFFLLFWMTKIDPFLVLKRGKGAWKRRWRHCKHNKISCIHSDLGFIYHFNPTLFSFPYLLFMYHCNTSAFVQDTQPSRIFPLDHLHNGEHTTLLFIIWKTQEHNWTFEDKGTNPNNCSIFQTMTTTVDDHTNCLVTSVSTAIP